MTDRDVTNRGASVRQQLLNLARTEGRVFQELATLYAMERFLFRLGLSLHAEHFVLKGGLMTLTWAGEYARVTRDIDLLGWGTNSVEAVVARLREVLVVEVDDGVQFDLASLQGTEITVQAAYVGVRVRLLANLAGMALPMQVDVGFGDAVVPAPDWIEYPQLDLPEGLTAAFAEEPSRQARWKGFVKKSRLEAPIFQEVVQAAAAMAGPAFAEARRES